MLSADIQLFSFLHSVTGKSFFTDSLIVFFASYLAYVLAGAFVLFVWRAAYTRREKIELLATAFIAIVLARGVITEGIRYFFPRERPFMALDFTPLFTESASSFPSAHATLFFTLSTVLYLYNKRWGTWFFMASVLITVARVMAGVHYPSDIVGGAIIGVCSGYFTYFFAHRWAKNQHIRPIDK